MFPSQKARELGLYNDGGINWEWFYGTKEQVLAMDVWVKGTGRHHRSARESEPRNKGLGEWCISIHRFD